MSSIPPSRAMRGNPDLNQLKRQAKELCDAYRARQPEAVAEVHAYHHTAKPESFALHDAQFVLARGADPVEGDAEPWATPQAWAEKMNRREILELLR